MGERTLLEAEPTRSASEGAAPSGPMNAIGYVGGRFVIFDDAERSWVFDARTRAAFSLDGRALRESSYASDVYGENGLYVPNAWTSTVVAARDRPVVLVSGETTTYAADLAASGAHLVDLSTRAEGGSFSPDGNHVATWIGDELTLARMTDGMSTRVSFARGEEPPSVTWSTAVATLRDQSSARVVSLDSLRVLGTFHADAQIATGGRGGLFAVADHSEAAGAFVVEVWKPGAAASEHRVASAFVSELVSNDSETKLAWVEHGEDAEARTWLHTLDASTGAHLRFPTRGGDCPIDHEHIVSIDDREVRTDAECSPGCPSLTSQADYLAYDLATGALLRRWAGPLGASYNEMFADRVADAERIAARLGIRGEPSAYPMLHHPNEAIVLYREDDGLGARLRLARATGEPIETLASSSGFEETSVRFTADGALLVAAGDAGAAVWDGSKGTLLFSVRSGATSP